jgi:hypothetical protein
MARVHYIVLLISKLFLQSSLVSSYPHTQINGWGAEQTLSSISTYSTPNSIASISDSNLGSSSPSYSPPSQLDLCNQNQATYFV